ncbi:ornithine cyclodeaminase family protein [Nocardia sp. NPDC051911]|uniref:ornithine cyclodeaminase family protein n=1 Tax=Nocardia sp. NPDC051911 TaxID=3154648 RepID=UPI003437FD25
MNTDIRFYREADVFAKLSLETVIEEVEFALRREHEGTATNIPKTMTTWGERSSAHALGALDLGESLVAFKTWVNTPRGAAAVATVFDAEDGRLHAVVQAGILGAVRTAAIVGVATRRLAASGADELAIIGSGRQSLSQVLAVHAVRPLRRICVWSPRPSSRDAFAEQIRAHVPASVVVADTLRDAVRGVGIVTLVTRATEPILAADDLAAGAHLNAVGAILPSNAEFDPRLLGSAKLTVVDNLENARRSSRELREFFGDDWSRVHRLADVVAGTVAPDDTASGPTVFKPLGMGLSDSAALTAFLRVVEPGLMGAR